MRARLGALMDAHQQGLRAQISALLADLEEHKAGAAWEGRVCPALVEEHRAAGEEAAHVDRIRHQIRQLEAALQGPFPPYEGGVTPGCLVRCGQADSTPWVFILMGAKGELREGVRHLSPSAPLARALLGREVGEPYTFREIEGEILEIYSVESLRIR